MPIKRLLYCIGTYIDAVYLLYSVPTSIAIVQRTSIAIIQRTSIPIVQHTLQSHCCISLLYTQLLYPNHLQRPALYSPLPMNFYSLSGLLGYISSIQSISLSTSTFFHLKDFTIYNCSWRRFFRIQLLVVE